MKSCTTIILAALALTLPAMTQAADAPVEINCQCGQTANAVLDSGIEVTQIPVLKKAREVEVCHDGPEALLLQYAEGKFKYPQLNKDGSFEYAHGSFRIVLRQDEKGGPILKQTEVADVFDRMEMLSTSGRVKLRCNLAGYF